LTRILILLVGTAHERLHSLRRCAGAFAHPTAE
jgi:hypothetical protein